MDLTTVTSYRTPASRDDLVLAPGERLLGGGTWLFSEPQPETSGLVDLTTLGWAPWEERSDGALRIAATCTIEQVQRAPWPDPGVVRACADAFLMSFKIQHAATVGGNLCLALPAGAMISLSAAYGADVVVWTPDGGERREPVTSFVRGPGATSLAAGEVVRAVEVGAQALHCAVTVRRIALTTYGRSSALVTARREAERVVLVVTASTPRPLELVLPADPSPGAVVDALAGYDAWYDDPHGPADWRRAMTEQLALEAVAELRRTTGGGAR